MRRFKMIKEFAQLRNLLIPYVRSIPDYTLRITVLSNLAWVRYTKQVKFVAKMAPNGARVLDIGCGLGQTTAMLMLLRPDLKVIGVDLKEAPTWGKLKRCNGCQFQVADALSLPFDREEFDMVVSFGVVEHVEDDKRALDEIHRVLVVGGHNVIFNLPNKYALPEFLGKMLIGAHHLRRYTKQQIITLLTNAGFRDLRIEREFIVPAHVDRVSKFLGTVFGKYYLLIDEIDLRLSKILAFFSESFRVYCRK